MAFKDSHGGHWGLNMMDPGALGCGYKEAEIAHKINELMRSYTGVPDTSDYKATSVNQNLGNIVTNMNNFPGDYHISNHLNAFNGTANGVEVWYWAGDESARQMAEKVSATIAKVTGLFNRGAKATTSLYVIRNSNGRTLLIEWGFIDNQGDMNKLLPNLDKAVQEVVKLFGYTINSNNQESVIKDTPEIEKILGGIGMFVYWQPQAKGNISDGYGVWGNKRFHLNNDEKVKHFKAMVRNATGAACREYRWPRGSEQIKTVESFTELQKTVV